MIVTCGHEILSVDELRQENVRTTLAALGISAAEVAWPKPLAAERPMVSVIRVPRGNASPLAPDDLDLVGPCGARWLIAPPAWANDAPALVELADAAESRGVTICLDTAAGPCENSRRMGQTMAELDHPALRLNFDLGVYLRLNPAANVEVALQRVLGWVGAVVLRDVEDATAVGGFFPPLGAGGEIDFAAVHQILGAVSFSGPAVIAFTPRDRQGPPPLEVRLSQLSESAELLRHCGWFDA